MILLYNKNKKESSRACGILISMYSISLWEPEWEN